MRSIDQMLKKISGLVGTNDITPWEDGFISDVAERYAAGQIRTFSEKQAEIIERIHNQHFA